MLHTILHGLVQIAVSFTLTIVSNSSVSTDNDDNSSLEYVAGSDVNLTCMVTPPPPSNSEFSWNCSTGCLEGVEMEQTISLANVSGIESGTMNCSMTISGNNFQSQSFQLTVLGKLFSITTLPLCDSVCP